MKQLKLTIATLSLGLLLTKCTDHHHHYNGNGQHQVTCYQSHTSTGELLFWYMLLSPNGSHYYYSSPTQITNFNNVSWSTDNTGFNQSEAQEIGVQSVESSGFSDEMTSTLESQESQGFDGSENAGTENSSEGSVDGGSESSGFDGGSSDSGGGDSGGGDGGGGE